MRVLVFGASITQGFWDTEGGWVSRLRRHYDEIEIKDFNDKQPTIFNLGISGNTSANLLKRFDNETSTRLRPDTNNGAIILSIGTNNAYVEGNATWFGPQTYKSDLEQTLDIARKYTDKIMFVGLPPCEEEKTTPVSWANISYTNDWIFQVDQLMRKVAADNKLSHVAIFERLQKEINTGKQIFADGLHPNNEGHQLIFELVRPELDKLLNS